MLRAIREIKPRWVVGENVSGIITWNGGMVFDEVQADLEAEGYEVQAYVLPAVSVNAPHRRDRVWFVAHLANPGHNTEGEAGNSARDERERTTALHQEGQGGDGTAVLDNRLCDLSRLITNPNNPGTGEQLRYNGNGSEEDEGRQGQPQPEFGENCGDVANAMQPRRRQNNGWGESNEFNENGSPGNWENFPTQSPICAGNDGLSEYIFDRMFQNENTMDRDIIIQGAVKSGRLIVDFDSGKIYSTTIRGRNGEKVELPGANMNGYITHNIYYDGIKKQCRAHQIVWIAANGTYDRNTLMIDHINRDKKDNRLCNLRLVDAKGNYENRTPYEGKLSQDEKDMMYLLHTQSNMTFVELGHDFGISRSRAQQIVSEHSGLVDITFPKWRNETIKMLGNSIVPQVAHQIFKAIEAYESLTQYKE